MSILLWTIVVSILSQGWALHPATPRQSLPAAPQPEKGLWEKPSAVRRATEGDVLVSVHYQKKENGENASASKFEVYGLTVVKGARETVFKKATAWEKVAQFSSLFQQATYYPNESQVAVDIAVLGFKSSILVQVATVDYQLQWKVLRGPFAGLTGVMEFMAKTPGSTQINSWGAYSPEQDPWSGTVTCLVLEGILERVGDSLKRYVER